MMVTTMNTLHPLACAAAVVAALHPEPSFDLGLSFSALAAVALVYGSMRMKKTKKIPVHEFHQEKKKPNNESMQKKKQKQQSWKKKNPGKKNGERQEVLIQIHFRSMNQREMSHLRMSAQASPQREEINDHSKKLGAMRMKTKKENKPKIKMKMLRKAKKKATRVLLRMMRKRMKELVYEKNQWTSHHNKQRKVKRNQEKEMRENVKQ